MKEIRLFKAGMRKRNLLHFEDDLFHRVARPRAGVHQACLFPASQDDPDVEVGRCAAVRRPPGSPASCLSSAPPINDALVLQTVTNICKIWASNKFGQVIRTEIHSPLSIGCS